MNLKETTFSKNPFYFLSAHQSKTTPPLPSPLMGRSIVPWGKRSERSFGNNHRVEETGHEVWTRDILSKWSEQVFYHQRLRNTLRVLD